MFLAEHAGRPVGRVDAWYPSERGTRVGFIDGPDVLPVARRQGIGSALLERAIASLRGRGAGRAENGAGDWNTAALEFLRRHAFAPAHSYSRMERDLTLVRGIGENREVEIRQFGESDDEVALHYGLVKSAFAEHHNFSIGALDEWTYFVRHQQDNGTIIERYFALDSGRPVGYVVVEVDRNENAHLGRKRGWVNDIGVLKEHRHRGIATRLLLHAIDRLRSLEMESVLLGVDDQNVTCARRVYERVGFRLVRQYLSFERAL